MSISKSISILVLAGVFSSCSTDQSNVNQPTKEIEVEKLSKSEQILKLSIEAHGGDLYHSAHYSFDFRGNEYRFKNDGNSYEYSKISTIGDTIVTDVLHNGDFNRMLNGELVTLTKKQKDAGSGGINSVIYFATLPYKLGDKSVHSKYVESITINDKEYDVIEVTFDKEGGGEDHDDEYYYWINKETSKIDYLAYNYLVNDGGVRFRSAYNTRVVGGVTFQDYINYAAEVGTPLKNLPGLYEQDKLKEVSRIKTENIINLNKK